MKNSDYNKKRAWDDVDLKDVKEIINKLSKIWHDFKK